MKLHRGSIVAGSIVGGSIVGGSIVGGSIVGGSIVGFADYIANGLFSESGFITNYHKQ